MHRQSGQSLVELVAAGTVIGIMLLMTVGALDTARRSTTLLAATSELRSIFQHVRALGIAHDRNVGVKFSPDGDDWTWTVYEDGDGDGVRSDDILRGTDRCIRQPRRFQHRPAHIGIPETEYPDPLAPGRSLSHRLPVRFGRSTLCSFSRRGEATNGSIVLTDGDRAVVLRVDGRSGRIAVYRWRGARWVEGE